MNSTKPQPKMPMREACNSVHSPHTISAAKISHALNFVRSAMAPAMRPTVRQANIAWKATKIMAGTLASGSSTMSPSRAKNSVTLPRRPEAPYDPPKTIE